MNNSLYLHDGVIGDILVDELPGLALAEGIISRKMLTEILRIQPECNVLVRAPAIDTSMTHMTYIKPA
jgi:hypothetical protein